jgi:hypothetical protein
MKSKKIFWIVVPLLAIILLPACIWDNLEELYPDNANCDTTSVSFSTDIIPILSNNCFSCHSNLNAPSFGGGLSFEDHQDVAGNSDRIIGAINHNEGFLAMPRDGDKLNPCSINLVEAWVNSGAPDN